MTDGGDFSCSLAYDSITIILQVLTLGQSLGIILNLTILAVCDVAYVCINWASRKLAIYYTNYRNDASCMVGAGGCISTR